MTLDEMRWMADLFQTGKMAKSADNLFISQPALSQCLQRIEKQLGFRLFDRTSRGLVATEKGKLFYETALKINLLYDSFLQQVDALEKSELKELTIGMAPYFSSCCSPIIVAELSKRFPNTRFRVMEASGAVLFQSIRERKLQMLIINEPVEDEHIVAHRFGCIYNAVFLRKGSKVKEYAYVEDGVRYLDPKYLAEEPICATYQGFASRRLFERIVQEAGIEPQIVHESQSISTLYRYAREGIASAMAPLTGQILEQAREKKDDMVFLIPESYTLSTSKMAICVVPEIRKLIPESVYQAVEDAVDSSPYMPPKNWNKRS